MQIARVWREGHGVDTAEMLFVEKKDQQPQHWEGVLDSTPVERQHLIKIKEKMVKDGNDSEGRQRRCPLGFCALGHVPEGSLHPKNTSS